MLLLHLCAIFAALVGLGVWRMGVSSDNPMANRQACLIVALPAFVYAFPLLAFMRTGNPQILIEYYGPWLGTIRRVAKSFFRITENDREDRNS